MGKAGGALRRVPYILVLTVVAVVTLAVSARAAQDERVHGNPSQPEITLKAELPTWSLPENEGRLRVPPKEESSEIWPFGGVNESELTVDDAVTILDELGPGLDIPSVNERIPLPGSRGFRVDDDSRSTEDSNAFNNGCKPPRSWRDVVIPKTLRSLDQQVGVGFRVARRGPFLVASDLPSSEFSALVDGVLTCCRECLANDYFDTAPQKVITIYAFRDETSYVEGLDRLFQMKPISPYGHYGHAQRYIVVNYDTGPGTLVHELTHALMAPDFPGAPIWISEGIASLYEQCRVEGDSLKGEMNWRLPELKAALQENAVTPLKTLFAMRPRTFRLKRESLHYAESRYFCLYMESQGLLRDVYTQFRDNFQSDPTGLKTVESAFGKPIEVIEDEWHDWIKTQSWK